MERETNFNSKVFGGYNKVQVDEYIAEQMSQIELLTAELEAVKTESETQKMELKTCLAEIIKNEEEIKTLTASNNAYIAKHDEVMQIEVIALAKADTLIANAKKTAEVTIYSAEIMAEHTTDCANIAADDIVAEAQKNAEEINAECHAAINSCTSEILNYQMKLNRFATLLQYEHSKVNTSISELKEKVDSVLNIPDLDESDSEATTELIEEAIEDTIEESTEDITEEVTEDITEEVTEDITEEIDETKIYN